MSFQYRIKENTNIIKSKAYQEGFQFCGISQAGFLEEEAPLLEKWLNNNMHGKMHYMENHFDKRLDPTKLVPGAKSVISLLFNYYPQEKIPEENNYIISKYAYGEDYHFVVKQRLKSLLSEIRNQIGQIEGRAFVDSAPVMDKAWAKKSGLGWIGKNTNLINKNQGSFFFIAELIVDIELEPDGPVNDFCGNCTRCIDACPTGAITEPYVVDGSKCISYYTIELKENIPEEAKGKFDDWIFGCDICQDVCPWNKFSKSHNEPRFNPSEELKNMTKKDWEEITEETFKKVFKNSPLKRTKFNGLQRNIKFVSE